MRRALRLAALAQPIRRLLAALRGRPAPPGTARVRPTACTSDGEAADPVPSLQCWPPGHPYSPVPDVRAFAREPERSRIWPPRPRPGVGVDWREEAQVRLVRELGARYPMSFPEGPTGDPAEYHAANGLFSWLDAWTLQAMLRHFRPRRVIEVGSGWSSLVTARVNREHLQGEADVTCIEPHAPDFLSRGVDGVSRLIQTRVQDVPADRFAQLSAGDVLFIDTTHTVKTGGDVVYLFNEVVPALAPGVLVHVHDIFLPRDYPEDWVMGGRAWNEQYLVQSFLAFNAEFEVLLGVAWLYYRRPEILTEAVPGPPEAIRGGGGSLWLRRAP